VTLTNESQWRAFIEARDAVKAVLAQGLRLQHLISNGCRIATKLAETPRKRIRQVVKLKPSLNGDLG
jgi:hypothetical protein